MQYKLQASFARISRNGIASKYAMQTVSSDVKPQKSWQQQGGVSTRFLALFSCSSEPPCDFKLRKRVILSKYNLLQL